MLSVTLRSDTDGRPWLRNETFASLDHYADFTAALFSGGDSRIATDPHTGLNKYLCPARPAPDLVCASSCTASPVSARGFDRAAEAFSAIALSPSPRHRADQLTALTEQIEARLLRYFGAKALAQVFLCPSGTDALLTTTRLIAAERPGEAITAILPAASETGTGVPMAAVGRVFDGPDSGLFLPGCAGQTVEIPLRGADGSPLSDDAVNGAFAAATAAATGKVIVYLTYGTKTGLIAPVSPPDGADVVVDACQARIEPATVAAYLRRGWPVVVTGSKFFGGPAFSGAVLFPLARLTAGRRRPHRYAQSSGAPSGGGPWGSGPWGSGPWGNVPSEDSTASDSGRLGTVLRWTASLAVLDAFEPMAGSMAQVLCRRTAVIERALAANRALVPVAGLRPRGVSGWADLPSIFTFGVRDPMDHRRLLPAIGLRPLYEHLAHGGILLGQPVNLGSFGGLRIAAGARELLDTDGDHRLARVFTALEEATARPRHFS